MDSVGNGFKVGAYDFNVKDNKSKLALGKSKLSFTANVYKGEDKFTGTPKTIEISARELGKDSFVDKLIAKLPGRVTINVGGKEYSVKTASLSKKFDITKNELKDQGDVKELLGTAAQNVAAKEAMKKAAFAKLKKIPLDKIKPLTFPALRNKYKLNADEIIPFKAYVANQFVKKLDPKLEGEKLEEAYKEIDAKCGLEDGSTQNIVFQANMKNSGY